jgi:phospholipid N-methyltransferase
MSHTAVMKTKNIKIPPAVAEVLRAAKIDGVNLRLTGQMDRKLYVEVDKVLQALGGKWNKSAKAHVFPGDTRETIGPGGCMTPAEPFEAMRKSLEAGVLAVSKTQLFPTPPELAERVIAAADIRPGDRILEPSAGTGALLDAILKSGIKPKPGDIQAVEINSDLSKALWRYPVDVSNGDFLAWTPETAPFPDSFDRIVMNPPFADQQDIRHVEHALLFLKPGGRLVAIMSAGVTSRQDRAAHNFRALVDACGGSIEALPDDAFKTSGTGVRTVLVTIAQEVLKL